MIIQGTEKGPRHVMACESSVPNSEEGENNLNLSRYCCRRWDKVTSLLTLDEWYRLYHETIIKGLSVISAYTDLTMSRLERTRKKREEAYDYLKPVPFDGTPYIPPVSVSSV